MSSKDRIALSKEELLEHLKEQIYFLVESSKGYDTGNYPEAKRIAHILRVLLHDTRQSKSLLGQLKSKDYSFYNTCDLPAKNLVSGYFPLISFKFNNPLGYRPWVIPAGTPDPGMWPKKKKMKFSDWWNMPVIATPRKYKNKISFCRRDVVLHVANTDGGSHVDPMIARKYAAMAKWNAMGLLTKQNDIEIPIDNPILPCVRQIGHEVILLLEQKYADLFPYPYKMIINSEPPERSIGTGVPTSSEIVNVDILG